MGYHVLSNREHSQFHNLNCEAEKSWRTKYHKNLWEHWTLNPVTLSPKKSDIDVSVVWVVTMHCFQCWSSRISFSETDNLFMIQIWYGYRWNSMLRNFFQHWTIQPTDNVRTDFVLCATEFLIASIFSEVLVVFFISLSYGFCLAVEIMNCPCGLKFDNP